MTVYLFKTEPNEYSYADLDREKSCVWTGVTNPQAAAFLRSVKPGDDVFVYHTGEEKAVVGLAKAASGAYADPDRPVTTASGEIKFPVVKLVPSRAARTPLTLAAIKTDSRFKDFALVKQSRLSVMPVPADVSKAIRALAGL